MTWSLIAKTPEGHIGIIVASRFFACGALVPFVGRQAAVATQAFINPLWGTQGLARLEFGDAAADVLADMVARDQGQAKRLAEGRPSQSFAIGGV